MTPEEAIKNLKKLKSYHNGSYGTAIDIAIKALEQQQNVHDTCKKCIEFSEFKQQPCEDIHGSTYGGVSWGGTYKPQQPCEDCISRDEAINVVHKYFVDFLKLNDDICLDGIRSLPSVTPQRPKGKWITKSQSLYMICTCCNTDL